MIFKDPVGGSGAPLQGPFFPQQGYGSTDPATIFGDGPGVSTDGVSYAAIAPRPTVDGGNPGFGQMPGSRSYWAQADPQAVAAYTYANQPYTAVMTTPSSSYIVPHGVDAYASSTGTFSDFGASNGNHSFHPMPIATTSNANTTNIPSTAHLWPYSLESSAFQAAQPSPAHGQTHFSQTDQVSGQQPQPRAPNDLTKAHSYANNRRRQPFSDNLSFAERSLRPTEALTQEFANQQVHVQNKSYGPPAEVISWVDEPADDWFDVESEDEYLGSKQHTSPSELGMMIAMSAQTNNGNIRSMSNFLNEPNVLSAYNPSYAASPLKDAQTARIFSHFITSTGPTLQVCERHPSNPAIIFSGRSVPKSQQSLWSYTLPMLALHHQGLLHSMLALSSLHIAKLQQSSPTPSLRHYHYALRRVAKALGNQRKRREPATLAATMLLGYYEITTAEHNKWNSHLSGARELVMDIPFAAMSKKVVAHYRQQEEAEAYAFQRQTVCDTGHVSSRRRFNSRHSKLERQLDKGLISTIMGWDVSYDNYAEVLEPQESTLESEEPLTAKHVDEYELQLDLFWWYAKQDTYQSLISGNRLL